MIILAACVSSLLVAGCGSKEKYAGEWKDTCVANLHEIQTAKQQWALEKRKTEQDIPFGTDLYGTAGYVKKEPVCPAGGTYSINTVGQKASCSVPSHNP